MKKYIFILSFFIFLAISAYSQGVRHIKGLREIHTSYGMLYHGGTIYKIGYAQFLKKNIVLQVGANYGKISMKYTDCSYAYANIGVKYNIVEISEIIFIMLESNYLLGGEFLKSKFEEMENGIFNGVNLGIESEILITDKYALFGKANQNFWLSSKVDKNAFIFNIGLRYYLF